MERDDVAGRDAMTRFYGKQFITDNGSKAIKNGWHDKIGKSNAAGPDADPGSDAYIEESPTWFCRNSAIAEYEDERIISYRFRTKGMEAVATVYNRCLTV